MKIIKVIGAALFCIPLTVHAGIKNDLNNYLNKQGFLSNTTEASSYKDQASGYYQGGSMFVRSAPRNLNPVNVQLPSYSAGCGGIDIFTGGFSFINSKQIVAFANDIVKKATFHAFSLSMEAFSPKIATALHKLQSMAQTANNFNMNSCEMSANFLGGVVPRTDASSKYLCQSMGTGGNFFDDWGQARQECNSDKSRDKVINNAQDKNYKDVVKSEYNIAWEAIKKAGFLDNEVDKELKELFMSLSGTVVSRKIEDQTTVTYYPSLITDDKLITNLLEGKDSVKMYHCVSDDDEKCLNIEK